MSEAALKTVRKWWGSQGVIRHRDKGWVEVGYRHKGGFKRVSRAKTVEDALRKASAQIKEPIPGLSLDPVRFHRLDAFITNHALSQWRVRELGPWGDDEMLHSQIRRMLLEHGVWMRPAEALRHESRFPGLRRGDLQNDLMGLRRKILKRIGIFAAVATPVEGAPSYAFVLRIDGPDTLVLTAYATDGAWWEAEPRPPK